VTNDQFVVTTQPAGDVDTGTDFGFVVASERANGTVDTAFSGSVTVALINLNPTDNGAILVGNLTETATGGFASFPGLELGLPGDYALAVSSDGVGSTLTSSFEAVGQPMPVALPLPQPPTAFQGFPTGTISLAKFAGTGGAPGSYTATIDWGDGSSPETVSASDIAVSVSAVTVSGSHVFRTAGNIPVTVMLTDGSGNSASSSNTITVGADVSQQVRVVGLGGAINPQTQLINSSGTITNIGGTSVAGPLYLVVQGLPAGVALDNADGYTENG
jgi:hypothetical protein